MLRTSDPQWRGAYEVAPIWNCAVPAPVTRSGCTLIGLLAPSHDRVGRDYPLCAGVALPPHVSAALLLDGAHEWLQALGRAVGQARTNPTSIEAFDDAVLAIPLPAAVGNGLSGGGGDDILSILNDSGLDVPTVPMPLAHALPWPDLPVQFDPDGGTSYWWTNTGNGGPLRGFTTQAGLSPSLLLTLMRQPSGASLAR
jgi:type VI secretion system protein ImpM